MDDSQLAVGLGFQENLQIAKKQSELAQSGQGLKQFAVWTINGKIVGESGEKFSKYGRIIKGRRHLLLLKVPNG
jgi:hypothetical protein